MARVLVTSRLAAKSLDTTWRDLLEQAGHEVVIAQVPADQMYPTEEQLKDLLQGITATVASSESYTRAVLESAPELRVISRVGVGYDAIDTAAAADHNVVAMIAAGSNDTTVAESAVAMILALARELYAYVTNTAPGRLDTRPDERDSRQDHRRGGARAHRQERGAAARRIRSSAHRRRALIPTTSSWRSTA